MQWWKQFPGPNAGWVLALYARYQQDPENVDLATRRVFDSWAPSDLEPAAAPANLDKAAAASSLAESLRHYGYLAADLDPLGSAPIGDPTLEPEFHGLDEADLDSLPASLVGGPAAEQAANAAEAIGFLRRIYASTSGYDYAHIRSPEEREWLKQAAETRRFRPVQEPIDGVALLDRLTQVEVFEQFIHRIFPGKHRFSVEGLDMLVPMLDEILHFAIDRGIRRVLIGMAHRGRLNVLAHILCKPYKEVLAEFKDPLAPRRFLDDMGWTGDVKYHQGAYRVAADEGQGVRNVEVSLSPNPSHVEAINPVIEGMARAAGTRADRAGGSAFDPGRGLTVQVHGDAAFPGQGVVAETLNLSRLSGYRTGGSIHIIANNQLGYTTPPEQTRSSMHASDLAKGFKIPIVHVNADDPVACLEAVRLACAYRQRFQRDFLIDLVGYRRYGHNEGDEPSFTQPVMYTRIDKHPRVRQLWADRMKESNELDDSAAEEMWRKYMDQMQAIYESLQADEALIQPQPEPPPAGAAGRVDTAMSIERLERLNEALVSFPEGFHLHPKLERFTRRRRAMLEDGLDSNIDWSAAEQLAFASILEDGIAIRLTGEDVERGTFSQRHAVFHDFEHGETYIPLQNLPEAKASFDIYNSPLTENAALAFEYGYDLEARGCMVLWEAQYGDFINNAQIVVDEFISSARAKWGLTPALVLLLPHGYEGTGPDHSSARIERFLALVAGNNMRIVNPTTAAQYFHVLRRQAALLETDPLPLIIFTPKSLLRHPRVASAAPAFTRGSWRPLIEDELSDDRREQVKRLLLCSGKVYVDLSDAEQHRRADHVAIARLEQLAPLPAKAIGELLPRYESLEEVIWVQEEPENMGAWPYVQRHLPAVLGDLPLGYVGRPASSSPAEGSTAWHKFNQSALIEKAYARETERTEAAVVLEKK